MNKQLTVYGKVTKKEPTSIPKPIQNNFTKSSGNATIDLLFTEKIDMARGENTLENFNIWQGKLCDLTDIDFELEPKMKRKIPFGANYHDLLCIYKFALACNDPLTKGRVIKNSGKSNIITCRYCCSNLVENTYCETLKLEDRNVKIKHNSIIDCHDGIYYTVCDYMIARKVLDFDMKVDFGNPIGCNDNSPRLYLVEHEFNKEACARSRHEKQIKSEEGKKKKESRRFNSNSVEFIKDRIIIENNETSGIKKRAIELIENINEKKRMITAEKDLEIVATQLIRLDDVDESPKRIEGLTNEIPKIDTRSLDPMLGLFSSKSFKLEPLDGKYILLDVDTEIRMKLELAKHNIKFQVQEGVFYSKYYVVLPELSIDLFVAANQVISPYFETLLF